MITAARLDRDSIEAMMRLQDDFVRALKPRAAKPREHATSAAWSPSVDIYEDKDVIVIRADVPGVNESDIDIEMIGDTLTIRGERKFADEVNRDKYIRAERKFGSFQRSFTVGIPVEADKVKASYRNGILELTLPKAEVAKPKKVVVSAE
jgi:HSP20 family protein